MIPIEYRLDAAAEKEYIEKVLACIGEQSANSYSDNLRQLLRNMKRVNISAGGKILKRAYKRFHMDYPDCYCLCMWLILSYEELEEIKAFLDKHMICYNLEKINAEAKHIWRKIKDIKSYHDLQNRRKKSYKYYPSLEVLLGKVIRYDKLYEKFEELITTYDKFSSQGINSWIVEKTEMNVCPYCNISYTYNRGNTVTAQLDHFYPKSEYSIFAVCFYNLIPSCSACNRMKYDGMESMASPYSQKAFENLRISWNYKGVLDEKKYSKKDSLKTLEQMIEIKIITSEDTEENNISKMKIKEAYQQHVDYASEIISKVKTYVNSESQKLICNICASAGITPGEVERFYFGNYVKEFELKNRPLSKMTKDFYEEYVKVAKSSIH